MLRILRFFAVVLIIPAIVSVGFAGGKKADRTMGEKIVTLGMVAYAEPKIQFSQTQPLADFLGKIADLQIKVKLYDDYYAILNDIDHESLDLAILSPVVYALCMDEPDLTYLATCVQRGKPFYHAVLLTRKDSPVLTVDNLKGKSIGFISRYSASGYVYPAAYLRDAGLMDGEKPLYNPVFLGSHARAVRALIEKEVDAVATYDNFFNRANHEVGDSKNLDLEDFRILKLLPEQIPNDAIVCRSQLGKGIIFKLSEGLKSYKDSRADVNSPLKDVLYNDFKFDGQPSYSAVKTFVEGIIEEK